MKTSRWLILFLTLCLFLTQAAAGAEAVYPSYTYNEWDESVSTPDGYTVEMTVRSAEAEGGPWKNPQDLCVTPDGRILLADTDNNRILEYDRDWQQACETYNNEQERMNNEEKKKDLNPPVTGKELIKGEPDASSFPSGGLRATFEIGRAYV